MYSVCKHRLYPVIWKVFVNNFSHLSLLGLKDVGSKEENHVQHGRLGGEGCAPVLRVGVTCYEIVNII